MAEVVEDIPPPVVQEQEPAIPVTEPVAEEVAPAPIVVEAVDIPAEPVVENDPYAERIAAAAKQSFFPEEGEFLLAKNYLNSKIGVKHSVSMYNHLTKVIMHALESKNANIVDNFEKLSLAVKNGQFATKPSPHSVKEIEPKHIQSAHAAERLAQLKVWNTVSDLQRTSEESNDADPGEIPDMMDLANLWEWAGVSFGKEDTFLLFLSIKKLVDAKQLKSVRLWGKIYGRDANYIVAEGELKEGVEDVEDAVVNAVEPEPLSESQKAKDEKKVEEAKEATASNIPVPEIKRFAPLAKEARTGVNKYIYYVCHTVGGPWVRLPDVIPERLQESRKIRKYFTGHLNAKISSYPAFAGNEAQYLRCQIARISSNTVVSPKGYYMVDPDAEESEEGNEYEGMANDQLANITNWVHHIPYILPQGKVVWEAPKQIKEEKEEKEEDEEEPEEEAPVDPETGPLPLTAISSDEEHGNVQAWSSRLCSKLSPLKFSPVTLRSNRWPGAIVLAYADKFANIYVGDGLKDIGNPAQNYMPVALGPIAKEYAAGEGSTGLAELLVEQLDPTVEVETAFEDEKRAKEEEEKEGDEEGADDAGDE
ncbi:Radial spoke head protein 4 A [Kappamyces sp. JEL0829]|nr:Radial spoke head protein 4 A [Kappamyces sp. JEL0829]